MTKATGPKPTVSVQELVLAQGYELAALMNVLERKGVLTQGEVTDEIRRLRARAGKASGTSNAPGSLPPWP